MAPKDLRAYSITAQNGRGRTDDKPLAFVGACYGFESSRDDVDDGRFWMIISDVPVAMKMRHTNRHVSPYPAGSATVTTETIDEMWRCVDNVVN